MRKVQTFDEMPRDFTPKVLVARRVHTVDPATTSDALAKGNGPKALAKASEVGTGVGAPTAVLVAGGRIAAVGSVDEAREAARTLNLGRPVTVDLGERTLLPGFVDPHAHPLMHGQMMTWVDCGPDRAATIEQIVKLLSERAATTPGTGPIRGYGYEIKNLEEGHAPTRHDLDRVATNREVYLMNASGHGGIVNTHTFETYGITRDTPNPPGGEFFKDANGELTGELSDAACNILTGTGGVKIGNHGPNLHLGDDPAEHLHQLRLAQDSFLSGGVTAVGDCQVTRRELDMYLRLADSGDLTIRYSMYFLSHLLDEGLEIGLRGGFGNSHLAFTGFKFYSDGTLGGMTAYFPDGYVGDPCRTGMLYHEPEEYARLVARAHAAGLQTATHTQSPTAIQMVLDAIAAAQAAHPALDNRHRLEHCGLPTKEQVRQMAELQVYPVNQTQHYYQWGEGVGQVVGTPGERFNPLGEFAAAGVPVTLSSDAPVADPRPMKAIETAVTRRTRTGRVLGPENLKIGLDAAIRAHTLNGAHVLGRESELGSITPGKRADFAVLDRDPYKVAPDDLGRIRVEQTWVDGELAHG